LKESQTVFNSRNEKMVAKIFAAFMQIYSNFNPSLTEGVGGLWLEEIDKLSDEQINNAIENCRCDLSSFAPNIVKFKMLAHGLHSVDDAYYHAYKKAYLTPAIYHAAYNSGMTDRYYRGTEAEQKIKFKSAYENICHRIFLGEEIIIQEQNKPVSEDNVSGAEKNKRHRSYLAKHFGVNSKPVKDFDVFCNMSFEKNLLWLKNNFKLNVMGGRI